LNFTERFIIAPAVQYIGSVVHNEEGIPVTQYDELKKDVRINPDRIECFEPVMMGSSGIPNYVELDGHDRSMTQVTMFSGMTYLIDMPIHEVEQAINLFKKNQYKD
jgi:hypothetical protein